MRTKTESCMINRSPLFKERMRIVRFLMLASTPMLLFIAPVTKEFTFWHELMEILAHLLVFSGVLIRVYTSLYSGGRKNAVLLTDGPYSVVRNPLYVGSLLAVIGLGLQTGSVIVAAVATTIFLVLHHWTIQKEEAFLQGHYGDTYRNYLRIVPRWMPNLSLWHQTQELVVKPRMVLLTMRDASGFIIALLLIETLCALRISAMLPAWIILP